MKNKKKILFLYTELASYFLSCVDALVNSGKVEVHIIRWPLNKEAPFDFSFNQTISVYERRNYNVSELIKLVDTIKPDLIYCSGWVDKGYKKICKNYKKQIPVIVGIDNQWVGTTRQKIGVLFSRWLVKKYFNKVWVPGILQKEFALNLGYRESDILVGFYSADTNYFNQFYYNYKESKNKDFPHRFIYVGRYLSFKGIYEMWNSFIELQNEQPNNWELWCLGTGAEYDKRIEHEKIKHFGFVQPDRIADFLKNTGVFILPSTFEPWGVVVHEFASSGFPIVVSDKVGAATIFVQNQVNGFVFESGNKNKLKQCMKQIMSSTDLELFSMGEMSHELAQQITPETWANKILSLLK